MKVLINVPELDGPGGVAYYYRCLRPHFSSETQYVAIGARSNERRAFHAMWRLLRDYANFLMKLSLESIDIVHLNPSLVPKAILRDAVFIMIAKVFRKKVVVFIRGWDPGFERLIRRYFLTLFHLIYSRADVFIVLSSEFQRKLVEMGFNNPIYRETTVVADSVLSRIDVRSQTERRQKGEKDFHILFLSRMERSKGIYLALDAFRVLRDRNSKVAMTVAGDGREAASAREYARRNEIDGVEFVGHVDGDQKHYAFSQADVYFFPTFHGEGMPNSVLEAMAYGLPIVTRPVGGIRDFFEDGKMGFVTESSSCTAFADLIETLMRNWELRSDMGCRGNRFVVENCMASKVVTRLQAIYSTVLSEATPR